LTRVSKAVLSPAKTAFTKSASDRTKKISKTKGTLKKRFQYYRPQRSQKCDKKIFTFRDGFDNLLEGRQRVSL